MTYLLFSKNYARNLISGLLGGEETDHCMQCVKWEGKRMIKAIFSVTPSYVNFAETFKTQKNIHLL